MAFMYLPDDPVLRRARQLRPYAREARHDGDDYPWILYRSVVVLAERGHHEAAREDLRQLELYLNGGGVR